MVYWGWQEDSFDAGYEAEEESTMLITEETYQLFVGIDSHFDLDEAKRILNRHLEGWTFHYATGSWRGKEETAVVITTSTNIGAVTRTAKELAAKLNQDAVGVIKIAPAMEFVS